MSKKSIFIFCLFFITFIASVLLSNFTFATDINMNLQLDSNNTNSQTNNSTNNTTQNTSSNTATNTNSSVPTTSTTNSATVSSISNLPEANLGLSNILNIILIVLGILLILLGIAIFIRLK